MQYCCTSDVVTREIPVPKSVRYPDVRIRLLEIMEADQKDRFADGFLSDDQKSIEAMVERETARIEEVLKLLEEIKTPSVRNIGLDGSRALWLVALHNTGYKDAGQIVLGKMKRLYYKDKNQVFYPGIPYLVDMVMLRAKNFDHNARQLYGTRRWYVKHKDGREETGNFPIINPGQLGERRNKFDLPDKFRKCKHYE